MLGKASGDANKSSFIFRGETIQEEKKDCFTH